VSTSEMGEAFARVIGEEAGVVVVPTAKS
jgi:hypothetical protein